MAWSVPNWALDEPSDIVRCLLNVTVTSEGSYVVIRGEAGPDEVQFAPGEAIIKQLPATGFSQIRQDLERWILELKRRVNSVELINL
jgi:hypothetical protein